MSEQTWQPARLIPTTGINGAEEQERRGTSALLAVLAAVPDFGLAVLKPLGAPAGAIESFIEVQFDYGEGRVIPDGLVRARRGQRTWTTLVEVKTGRNDLRADQLETYLDVARANEIPLVLTISNQIATQPGVHPVLVDKRKLRKVRLAHLSWTEVLSEAVMVKVHRGVSDPDQAFILGELIRYLEHPKSGALEFEDMGTEWVTVRNAIEQRTLRTNDKQASVVAAQWEQLIRHAALRLGRELGADVQPVLTRRDVADPQSRITRVVTSMVDRGVLEGSLRIPGAVGAIRVTADVRAGRVFVATELDAPTDGRPTTRVNWLVRQLKEAPAALRIDAVAARSKESRSELLGDARENPGLLGGDGGRELRSFRVSSSRVLGSKRGAGKGSFVSSILITIDEFYADVVQKLRPWVPRVPQLPAKVVSSTGGAATLPAPPSDAPTEAADPMPVASDGDMAAGTT